MARPRRIDLDLVAKAQVMISRAANAKELRAAQAILLPALVHTTLEQTAALLGVGRASVPRLQQRFREKLQPTAGPARSWGGRRRAMMTLEQEKSFLAPWAEQARDAGLLVVSPLRAALAEKLGRKKIAASVVYRLLARHGWRKVAPDTRHPNSDPSVQAEWKKNFRKRWMPC
jgi:transposase